MPRVKIRIGVWPVAAIAAAALAIVPGALAAPARTAVVPQIPPPRCMPAVQTILWVDSGSYSPATRTVPTPGSTEEWEWSTGSPESVTTTGALPLLHSAAKTTGTYEFTFWSAGTYGYHSSADAAQKGVIAVSMCNVPKTAHAGSVVWLQAASAHRRGWVADIEVLRPGATKWVWLKTDVTTTMVSLTPERAGTYEFRARVRDKAIKTASGFSPISKMHVS